MNRLLLIVDPQIDFITGTLPVPGAIEAMDRLAEYIRSNDGRYIHKIVTADRHPFFHCSFRDSGGEWPRHCVHDTAGAAVWQSVLEALYMTSGEVTMVYKGENPREEEYSVFKNQEDADVIESIVSDLDIGKIDICGLAGDICVRDTLNDGISRYGSAMFNLLREFSPAIQESERTEKI